MPRPTIMGLLDGKAAVITGAGEGIGRAHALAFAREGARVVVNDTGWPRDRTGAGSRDVADRVVDEIVATGGAACASYDDVATAEGAEAVVQRAVDEYGALDILVNNAGILRDKPLTSLTDEMWREVISVHLTGAFLCVRAAARSMIARGEGGAVINTTSVSGMMGNFGQANYSAAKAGVYGLTRAAAIELRRHRITVNALAPVAHTRMTRDLPMMQAMPNAADLLSPERVAPAAIFLASELARDITGHVLAVEGNRLYAFKVVQTNACVPEDPEGGWTAEEIRQRWSEICGNR